MTVKGWSRIQAQFKAISQGDYTSALEKAVRGAILPEMQALTPVDEGELLASEDVVREGDTVSLVAGTDHAIPVEFGTIHMVAQPYMRPAIDTKKGKMMQIMAKETEVIIKRVI